MSDNKIIVKGFSKIGTIINDDPSESHLVVEFEKIKILVDKKSQTIILPSNCVTVQN